MYRRLVTLTLVATLIAGCGSMEVRRVGVDSSEMPSPADPSGLRIQIPAPHDVYVVLQDRAGQRVLQQTTMSLATMKEFYDLDFRGGPFTSRELSVSLHPNGTLKEYSFTAAQKVSDTIDGLADATSAINEARLAIKEAEKPAVSPDPVAEENEELQLQLINLMLKANIEALLSGQKPPFEGIPGGSYTGGTLDVQ